MFTSTSNTDFAEAGAADVLIPLIRAAATIGFAIAPCSLGFVIIAVSEQLIRSIMVGDDPEMLMSDLQNQFPNHAIELNENDDAGLVAKVVDLIERPDQALDLPLDIRGTDFQMRVWDALQNVPAGTTVSYTFLAEQIGAPTAVRAVAQACAANPLAVAIPCHRAVRADGDLAGYRWGTERKRALLEREAKQRGAPRVATTASGAASHALRR
jgi:AraC family transcriptional regulator, regulatory protein of adaptative response / methylated-DNA-[protein]-cysteine methyltransferase